MSLTKTETLSVETSYTIKSVTLDFENLRAEILCSVKTGDFANGLDTIVYEGEEWNHFWSNFNSFKFVNDEVNAKKALGAKVTNEVEVDVVFEQNDNKSNEEI